MFSKTSTEQIRTGSMLYTEERQGCRSMRVFVTGDRGYIGQVLVPTFRAAGHDVVGLDAGWYDGCDFGPLVDGLRAAGR